MSAEGCTGAKGRVRDGLLISYGEELERRYNRELGVATSAENGECEGNNEGSAEDSLDADEMELSRLCREAHLARTEEDKESVKRRLLALRSRVDARQLRLESKAENARLEMVRHLREMNPNKYGDDFFPPFDEWMAVDGCRGAKGTVRDSLFIFYCEEMERCYNRERESEAWEWLRGGKPANDGCPEEGYDLDSVIARAEAVKGGPLTSKERAELERKVLELEELERKIAEFQGASPSHPSDNM